MFGSAASAAPTFGAPKGRSSFGGLRGASPDVEFEEETDEEPKEGVQRIGLSEGAITLEQVSQA